MSDGKAVPSTGSEATHPDAVEGEDGYWRGPDGVALKVSASDLERYTYCPLSWHLATSGHEGKSDAIEEGKQRHMEIHESMETMEMYRLKAKRNLLIWQWWFGIIVLLLIDTIAFRNLDDLDFDVVEFSKLLAMASVSSLLVGIAAVLAPWRQALNVQNQSNPSEAFVDSELIEPLFEPKDFKGGWFKGGWVEAALFIAAIVLALHAIALQFASNKEQASYVLAVTTVGWTLLASIRLQKALIDNNEAQILATKNNVEKGTEVAYSDDEDSASLLINAETGLRGRPDQIVIIDSEFIPVEQKTGKVPAKPHDSHVLQLLAYASLVETTTGQTPPYGLIRYRNDTLYTIPWDDEAKERLSTMVKTIQRTMATGGAKRNHEREGKCRNCSRRYACDQRLA
ncbi:MAG: Dna2/Cas4 domain-containing protein [Candidatus Poseidoniales archaeon]|nr:MAG: Dna2/Cas4 domain-containing protein [Candidatus Poseidoniales archaeon]